MSILYMQNNSMKGQKFIPSSKEDNQHAHSLTAWMLNIHSGISWNTDKLLNPHYLEIGQIENSFLKTDFHKSVKWLFTHPFPVSWVIFAIFGFLIPRFYHLSSLVCWSSGFLFLLCLCGCTSCSPCWITAKGLSFWQLSLSSTYSYNPVGALESCWSKPLPRISTPPHASPWRVSKQCLIKWLLPHSLSHWNHFHTNDHFNLPISLVK